MQDRSGIRDELLVAINRGRALHDGCGLYGAGIVELFGPDGDLLHLEHFGNIITTAGDQYYLQKALVAVQPANGTAPTIANGMKLGSGSTAASKSGAGAAIVTYITNSNNAFDATFPTAAAVGGDTGWVATYKTTWPAGDSTNANIQEVVIVNDQATDATSTAANTYARAVITSVNKAAGDSLAITWAHTFLGA